MQDLCYTQVNILTIPTKLSPLEPWEYCPMDCRIETAKYNYHRLTAGMESNQLMQDNSALLTINHYNYWEGEVLSCGEEYSRVQGVPKMVNYGLELV